MAEPQNILLCKNKELEIDPNSPFDKDVLERKESIEKLTTLIESTQQPFVLSVEAPWGWGKTTFIRMWRDHLKNRGHVCLHFSAWESDFVDDPLTAFLGEMQKAIKQEADQMRNSGVIEGQLGTLIQKGAALGQKALPVLIRAVTAQALGEKGAIEILGLADISGDVGEFVGDIAKDRLERYESEKNGIRAFRESLQELAEAVIDKGGRTSPVVFFVDELDRCRPDFAIKLLERIKHLFSVRKVVFILAIDRSQMNESVRALYGAGADSNEYMRRFIDMAYKLPEPQAEGFATFLFRHFNLSECFSQISPEKVDLFLSTFSVYARGFKLSLRAQEHCFTQMNIVFRVIPNTVNLTEAVSFLVCLQTNDSSVFQELRAGRRSIEDVMLGLRQVSDKWLRQLAEAILVYGFLDDLAKESRVQVYRAISENQDADWEHASRVLEAMNYLSNNWMQNPITLILSQIELIEQIRIIPRLRT